MPTTGTNEIFENLLENQNAYIRSGETARNALDTKVTNAMRQLVNDDTALSGIDTKVTNAMSQLINDDTALSGIDTKVTAALSSLNTLANREYGYTHEAIVTDDLEKDYQSIITETPSLADVSAVGLLAVLKNGDAVTAQGNRLFINGEEVVNPNGYTFSGINSQNGIEVVKIWYFQDGADAINLSARAAYDITATIVKVIDIFPTIDVSYLVASSLELHGFVPPATYSAKSINDVTGAITNLTVPTATEYYTSAIQQTGVNSSNLFWFSSTANNLRELRLEECTGVKEHSFQNIPKATIIFSEKLTSITNASYSNPGLAPFRNVGYVTLPESVTTVPIFCFNGVKGIN